MAQRKNPKWQVHEAIQTSELHPFARLLLFVFADLADSADGVVPEQRTPSIQELVRRTGISKASVVRHKDDLVSLGWLLYRPPNWDQMAAHGTGRYAIRVGRNPEPGSESQGETPAKGSKGRRKAGPVSQEDTPNAVGPDRPTNLGDQGSVSQSETPPEYQTETSPVSHRETPVAEPVSHTDTAGVSERDRACLTVITPVSHTETPIKEPTPTYTDPDLSAADAAATGADEGPKTTDRKRSGSPRKTAKPKQPDPVGDTAQELTVAFFERYKDENVQTFPAVRGVVKTALERGVPRDVLAHAMAGVMERGYAISGQSLTVELNRMRQVANGTSRTGMTTGQQRLADAADIADEMRRLDEAEATHQPPILFALPPGRTA